LLVEHHVARAALWSAEEGLPTNTYLCDHGLYTFAMSLSDTVGH